MEKAVRKHSLKKHAAPPAAAGAATTRPKAKGHARGRPRLLTFSGAPQAIQMKPRKKGKYEEKLDTTIQWPVVSHHSPVHEEFKFGPEQPQPEIENSGTGYFVFPEVFPPSVERSERSDKMHVETPQFRDIERFGQNGPIDYTESKREDQSYPLDDFQPDTELKRAFSFCSKGVKRPPELNIELISNHTPSFQQSELLSHHSIEPFSRFKDSNNQPMISPISAQALSPLAMPGQGLSLANTPTMLHSFMNVLKKDGESHAAVDLPRVEPPAVAEGETNKTPSPVT